MHSDATFVRGLPTTTRSNPTSGIKTDPKNFGDRPIWSDNARIQKPSRSALIWLRSSEGWHCGAYGLVPVRQVALVEAGGYSRLLTFAEKWTAPKFPLKGADLQAIGMPAGPDMGKLLKRLEEDWIESGFRLDRGALLERAAARLP